MNVIIKDIVCVVVVVVVVVVVNVAAVEMVHVALIPGFFFLNQTLELPVPQLAHFVF